MADEEHHVIHERIHRLHDRIEEIYHLALEAPAARRIAEGNAEALNDLKRAVRDLHYVGKSVDEFGKWIKDHEERSARILETQEILISMAEDAKAMRWLRRRIYQIAIWTTAVFVFFSQGHNALHWAEQFVQNVLHLRP